MGSDRLTTSRWAPRIGVALAALALVAAWYAIAPGPVAGRTLREARDLWNEREPAAYSFDFVSCSGMCAHCPVHITVRDGRVVGTRAVTADASPGCGHGTGLTIDDVFGIADRHLPTVFGDTVTITYDPQWGFPAQIDLVCRGDTSDCGSTWSVGHFDATGG